MFALGQLCQDAFGQGTTGPFFTGLACVPNTPAAMNVIVQPGAVYAQAALDTTAYSSLAADSTVTMKQGILKTAQTFATPAPTTSGQSIVYLISASFLEADTNAVVLPYYNASNPSQAYSGPSGTGASQNTTRQDTVALTLTTGVPATTGSQLTPATPNGQTALYTITVAYGATSVTASNIASVTSRFTGFARMGYVAVGAATNTLTAANAGQTIGIGSVSATTTILPAVSSVPVGTQIEVMCISNGAATIQTAGADQIYLGTSVSTSFQINYGDNAILVAGPGNGYWYALAGSAQLKYTTSFGSSLAASGYQKLPSGLIIQWGISINVASGGSSAVTLPIAFPNAGLHGYGALHATTVSTTSYTVGCSEPTTTAITIYNYSAQAASVKWLAIGY